MRTMASVSFMVVVLIMINDVFGNTCSLDNDITNCNDCMRCGYHWCNSQESTRCTFQQEDDWCSAGKELLPTIDASHDDRIYAVRTLAIGTPNILDIQYTAHDPKRPLPQIVNTTQTLNIEIKLVEKKSKCDGIKCVARIEAIANKDFCNAWGGVHESVYAQVYVGNYSEAIVLKYHVPCACACSLNVTKSAAVCNGHGDFSCGHCECYPEWQGDRCDQPNCPEKRGDVQCMDTSRMDVNCFGNGYCGPCDTCICFPDREGSQYFDEDDYCGDLCTLTSDCDTCLHNNSIGYCPGCIHSTMQIIPKNLTVENERDSKNRKVWMRCNITVFDCSIDYLAMRDEEDQIFVMIDKSCNDKETGAVVVDSTVPIILGVLAVVAVVMAAAGVMIWKHVNAVPPLPLNDSQYQNIGAEDCQYQNPLYVSPTTSFKNPMFGKAQ